ncbi:MAG: 8-amino-7-oxononanoate synthase, partial [Marmoricola sp.]
SSTIDLAGNDYLGLARHPEVIEGAVAATRAYGAGAGASRLVTGTLALHEELETALADYTGSESGLVLSTGYHANLSVLSALVDEETLVVSDAHVHASMIDGCRLARAQVRVAPHGEIATFDALLAQRTQKRALVLTESIFSVLGDATPLLELLEVCRRTDALLVVDEAHGLGVAGDDGSGLARQLGAAGDPHLLITGTLSKSFGAQGGIVLGARAIREQLVNRARPFIYDTGLAPSAAGAALAALEVIRREPDRVARVNRVAGILAEACGVQRPAGAVLAVPMSSPQAAVAAVEKAATHGVRIGCFRPPSTPDGISRLRLTAHADLDDTQMDHATRVLAEVAR